MIKKIVPILFLVVISVVFIVLYLHQTHSYLRFSDGAKFADIAQNLARGKGYTKSFSFFSNRIVGWPHGKPFDALFYPPLFPYSIALVFKLIGISDFSVMFTSSVYFIGSVVMTYLLGKKLFNNIVGIMSSIVVASNLNLLDYATNGASETAFIFLILLTLYLIILRRKITTIASVGVMILLYLTRTQAVIYILGIVFLIMLIRLGYKKSILFIVLVFSASLAIDHTIIYPLSSHYNVTPLFERGVQAIKSHLVSTSPSEALRGAGVKATGFFIVFRKLFYNLFNYYKLLPDIISPYLFFAFVMGLFIKAKNTVTQKTKFMVLFVTILTFTASALTIPFFRYIHPVIPLVYIFGVGTIFIVTKKFKLPKLIPVSLVLIFVVLLSVLTMFVDARFNRTIYNLDKPPVYTKLSRMLQQNTNTGDVVVTNLDTWGSWYGERKTVWYPIKPEQLISKKTGEISFDVIFLTSYLMDDENYYMGDEWREIFLNPTNHGQEVILDNFEFKGEFDLSADDVYENKDYKSILLVKKI